MKTRILNNLTNPSYFHPEKGELNLSRIGLTANDVINFIVPFLNKHPEIKKLDLSFNQIGTKGAKALADASNLKILNISRNRHIGDEGAVALSASNLKTLDISYNNIGDEGAVALSASNLKTLNLNGNKIGDKGAKALSANTKLEMLKICQYNKFSESGTKALDETDPIKRANYGREVGLKTEVPSLTRLCLFKIKNSTLLDRSVLPNDLHTKLEQPKF